MGALIIILFIIVIYLITNSVTFNSKSTKIRSIQEINSDYELVVFAGGCFWCTESDFEHEGGVISAISGYTGGFTINPSYNEVSRGGTGHVEAVEVLYDPKIVTYEELLEIYFTKVDPTDHEGQFIDRGSQYRPVIFYVNQNQKDLAERAKKFYNGSGIYFDEVTVEILPLGDFYIAEEYHQDYYIKNPTRYKFYRGGSGRDQFLNKIWDKNDLDLVGHLHGDD